MRGEQGKLREIASLKSKYKFRFLVDDAHGFGTLGKNILNFVKSKMLSLYLSQIRKHLFLKIKI